MKKLSLFLFTILILGCTSKPNQTVYNRPNTVLAPFVDDFKIYPMDPQLNSVWVIRALRSDEEWAEYPDTIVDTRNNGTMFQKYVILLELWHIHQIYAPACFNS